MRICMGFDIGTANLGFAAAAVEDGGGEAEILRAEVVNIKASSTDASVLKLWAHLDAAVATFPADAKIAVYIEQQPSMGRSVMRSVELAVRHYFLMLSRSRRRVEVKGVSSRSKLGAPVVYAKGATLSQKYRARKKASIAEIGGMTASDAPRAWAAICNGKADDVCDALLYIVRHGRVTKFRDAAPADQTVSYMVTDISPADASVRTLSPVCSSSQPTSPRHAPLSVTSAIETSVPSARV
jgi:hypothetical protein